MTSSRTLSLGLAGCLQYNGVNELPYLYIVLASAAGLLLLLLIVVLLSVVVARRNRRSSDSDAKSVGGPQQSRFPRPTVAACSLQVVSDPDTTSVTTGEGDDHKYLSILSDNDDYLAPNPTASDDDGYIQPNPAASDNNDDYLAPNPTASDDDGYIQPNPNASDNNDEYLVPNPDHHFL